MMGALKGDFFPQQILNKNRLCLAHCVLNRSFTVCASRKQIVNNIYLVNLKYQQNFIYPLPFFKFFLEKD